MWNKVELLHMSISGLKPYNMIKFRLHMIPPSKKPWIARNRNQLAWMFPRESSTMERSPLCSATPTSVSKSNLWALWQLLEHRIEYHNSSYTMLYAATHALFTICPWLWLTLTKTSFREEWYCGDSANHSAFLQKNGEAISADPGRQKFGARKGKKEAAPLLSPPESLRIISAWRACWLQDVAKRSKSWNI